mmetsp:Transcript_2514/g.7172  ORF Transcript_2514/g.7172 Transcript_2514/m.7172 type:complete len:97 (-) Transcript_2514:197-487(-)|eukprot:CAMPEP_0117687998 /NCGR_PEP_ID=MMETSP0804-20121206/23522_1 /TAXON_ID=1074897 /ORGANISM="Tetraselmis astigmatica, Strain CCMP880" /LENGTH=96 /DNA_ID=CAMNT_0005500275 /DNA_START=154 /DNA_END=444 /DNA_ORIENTATION=+
MAKGGSSSQASQSVPRGGGAGGSAAPRSGLPPGSSGAPRRRPTARSAGPTVPKQSIMNFYTDDAPGLKISPVMVLIMSLGFIGFVTLLHVIGKIRG